MPHTLQVISTWPETDSASSAASPPAAVGNTLVRTSKNPGGGQQGEWGWGVSLVHMESLNMMVGLGTTLHLEMLRLKRGIEPRHDTVGEKIPRNFVIHRNERFLRSDPMLNFTLKPSNLKLKRGVELRGKGSTPPSLPRFSPYCSGWGDRLDYRAHW